ncbi:MAG: hypothetical protein AAFO77_11640, partial [Pseudomonadota bacterium]
VLMSKPDARKAIAQSATRVVSDMEGAFERTWETLQPYVTPLIVSVGLNGASASKLNGQGQGNGSW